MFDIVVTLTLLVAVGLGAGTLGAMLGVGGGIIMVPALTLFGITPSQIASTSLFAVTSTSVSSTVEYSRQKKIDYRLGILMAAMAVPGAVLGAFLSSGLSGELFRLYFGILLILAGLYILYKNSLLKKGGRRAARLAPYHYLAVSAASVAAGIISSLFGIGGGVIFVPLMLLVLGIGMHRAAATSQMTLMVTSIAGVLTHVALGHPDYLFAIALSAGAFAGGQIGARLSKSAKDALLQRILGVILIAVGGKLTLDWLFSR
ncbi:MAG TPA: sulfite exporter TauE/SafE family protein [Nitrososphaera sp.]|nr:sulfite exporter TauE/SafE family protein [Nitrososphaera sp.]